MGKREKNMRILILLALLAVCVVFAQPAAAERIAALTITVEINKTKANELWWDHNPMGRSPDPYGSITIPGNKREIPPQENTFALTCTFRNVDLNPGDPIIFDLADRDRGRMDDEIARGTIPWSGKARSTHKLGFATITIITGSGSTEGGTPGSAPSVL
jgi:hypothetical protein